MAERLLTAAKIRRVRCSEGEQLLADGKGLYLRLRPEGRDWLFKFCIGGKRRKQGLGPYPDVSLDRARERALVSRALVADGIDPVAFQKAKETEQRAAQVAEASRPTIHTLFEEWHRREVAKRKDGGQEARRTFIKDVLPIIGDMHADQVKRCDVVGVLDRVKERSVTRTANLLLQHLRQMFKYAALRDIVGGDPTIGLTKKLVGGIEKQRERLLSEDEIRELARKLPEARLLERTQAALWIMLATCCRVGEISRARWADIDLHAGTWTVPAEHSKNRRAHLVHLSDFALWQFGTLLHDATEDCDWVMPNSAGTGHLDVKTLQKQLRDRQRQARLKGRSKQTGTLVMSGGEWRCHDLRRTGATLMGELGIRSDVIERCLGHSQGSKLVKTYQQQQLLPDRRAAFDALGVRLDSLTRAKPEALDEHAPRGRSMPCDRIGCLAIK